MYEYLYNLITVIVVVPSLTMLVAIGSAPLLFMGRK